MLKIKVDIDFSELYKDIIEIENRTLTGFKEVLVTSAKDIETKAKDNVRSNSYKTGALHDSIKTIMTEGEATIIADAEHGAFIEYGTRAHTIRPRNKKALAFNGAKGLIIVKEVNHPGTQAKPFMEPAFNKVAPEYIRKLEELINGSN